MNKFWCEKGQISIEMILILAAVIAFVLILVSQLFETGNTATQTFEDKSNDVFDKIKKLK